MGGFSVVLIEEKRADGVVSFPPFNTKCIAQVLGSSTRCISAKIGTVLFGLACLLGWIKAKSEHIFRCTTTFCKLQNLAWDVNGYGCLGGIAFKLPSSQTGVLSFGGILFLDTTKGTRPAQNCPLIDLTNIVFGISCV